MMNLHMRPLMLAVLSTCPFPVLAAGIPTLQEVTVNSSSKDLIEVADSASEGTVTAKQLANRPLLRPAEVMEVVPGLIVTQHSGDEKGVYSAEDGDFATSGSARIDYQRKLAAPFIDLAIWPAQLPPPARRGQHGVHNGPWDKADWTASEHVPSRAISSGEIGHYGTLVALAQIGAQRFQFVQRRLALPAGFQCEFQLTPGPDARKAEVVDGGHGQLQNSVERRWYGPQIKPGLRFEPAFDYEQVLVVARHPPLAQAPYATPADMTQETLITYPVATDRLDIYTGFPQPAAMASKRHKTIETTDIMQMVAALPRWLVQEYADKFDVVPVRLGQAGIAKQIFLGARQADLDIDYLKAFIKLARESAETLGAAST